jgi:UDPglucose 6-dehydrogenase
MKLAMIGTGYVGLVSGACFAETGNHVICADIDTAKIERLVGGEIPIFEPGLGEMAARNVAEKRLSFSSDVGGAIAESEVVCIAVGTPPRSDGAADLHAVDRVAETVAEHVARESVLVIKSTVPVGTNARVRRIVKDAKHRIHVVSNPEFLKEGNAIDDFMKPDRIVIGCDDDFFVRDVMSRLYHPVTLSAERIVWMDPASAELTKYVANTMLAMRISFMNEVAALCEKVGADIHLVRNGVGSDERIGSKFLHAGPGFGGSCFPKDVAALATTARDLGVELELASTTDRVNRRQKGVLARKLKHVHFDGDLRGKRIAVWGLAFKPRTDDVRESPALQLIDTLLSEGAEVAAHDPEAMPNVQALYGDRIKLVQDAYDAAQGADALVLVTEWRQYQNPDFARLVTLMRRPLLLDGRNIWSSYGLRKLGFIYDGIGVRGS